jgi:hypothetical protein
LGGQQPQQQILHRSGRPQGGLEIVVHCAQIEQALQQWHVDFPVLGS